VTEKTHTLWEYTDDKRGLASRFFGREDVYAGLFFLVVFLRLSIHNLPPPFFGFFVWLNVPSVLGGLHDGGIWNPICPGFKGIPIDRVRDGPCTYGIQTRNKADDMLFNSRHRSIVKSFEKIDVYLSIWDQEEWEL